MSGGVTIRAARRDECEDVLRFWRHAGALPTVTDTLDAVRSVVDSANATLLVAEDGRGALAGTVIAGWDGWRGTLYRLAVGPEHRRRGLARALVEAAVDWHREQGARRVVTFTHLDEPHAMAFWRSLGAIGFQETEGDARFVLNL